jgi:hypothetical protein
MLHVLSEYAATWRFDINHKKSSVLISGHAPKSLVERMKAERWLVDGDCIKVVDSYTYLGLDFGPLVQGKWRSTLSRMCDKAKRCLNLFLWQAGGSNGLRPEPMGKI